MSFIVVITVIGTIPFTFHTNMHIQESFDIFLFNKF